MYIKLKRKCDKEKRQIHDISRLSGTHILRQFSIHDDGICTMESVLRDALHEHRQYSSFWAQTKLVEALESLRLHGIRQRDLSVKEIFDYLRQPWRRY